MRQNKILVFIPTYDERENVEEICSQILATKLDCDLLFMDDNSPDGTGQLLNLLAKENSNIKVIHRSGKLGIGSAHSEGIQYALDNQYEYLITMDCDFTHSPSDLKRLLDASENCDLVIGSRYIRKNSLPGWSVHRRATTFFAHFLTKNLLGIKCDASGALRLYKLEKINPKVLSLIQSKSYSFFFESLFILLNDGMQVKEIPISLPARTYGHSKMSLKEVWRSGIFLMKLTLEKIISPGRFQTGRLIDKLDPTLKDPQDWSSYWGRKTEKSGFIYEAIATLYRTTFIRSNLYSELRKNFKGNSKLLHAGCGSGQVDEFLHDIYEITAVDINNEALELYSKNNKNANRIEQASIFSLPFLDNTFDGIYNLGVMEHFNENDICKIFKEFKRVLKPNGRIVMFWPHRLSTSVATLKAIKKVIKIFTNKNVEFHPEEISLVRSREYINKILNENNLQLNFYRFNFRDLYVQSVIVCSKK